MALLCWERVERRAHSINWKTSDSTYSDWIKCWCSRTKMIFFQNNKMNNNTWNKWQPNKWANQFRISKFDILLGMQYSINSMLKELNFIECWINAYFDGSLMEDYWNWNRKRRKININHATYKVQFPLVKLYLNSIIELETISISDRIFDVLSFTRI